MSRMLRRALLIASLLAAVSPAQTARDTAVVDRASELFTAGEYAAARTLFERALDAASAPRGGLHHALGHCAFRVGEPAVAYWHYRCALRRRPGDQDLHHDLRVTADRLGIDPPALAAADGVARTLTRLAAVPAASLLALAVVLESLGLLALLRRRRLPLLAGLLLLLALTAGVLAWNRAAHDRTTLGVVLRATAVLRPEPHDTAPTLLRTRAGQTLRILERSDRWAHVEHPLAGRGWVRWEGIGVVE